MSILKTLENYKFDSAVQDFLGEFPFLEKALEDGYPHIRRLFGDEAEIVLKVITDAEISDWRTLFAYIWTGLDVDDALDKHDELDDNWYVHLPYAVRREFCVNVKCK